MHHILGGHRPGAMLLAGKITVRDVLFEQRMSQWRRQIRQTWGYHGLPGATRATTMPATMQWEQSYHGAVTECSFRPALFHVLARFMWSGMRPPSIPVRSAFQMSWAYTTVGSCMPEMA